MELAISAIEITAHTTLPVVKTFQHLLLSSAKDLLSLLLLNEGEGFHR